MNQTDFFQINTLVRIREKTLLSAQQKNALLRAPDLLSAVKLLTEWDFFLLSELSSPGDFLRALLMENRGWILWAKEIAPDTSVAEMFMLSDTVHNLKVFLKERITGKSLERLYTENSLYQTEDFRRLLDDEEAKSEIPIRWQEQIHQALEDYKLHHSLARIDFRLDTFYYAELMNASAMLGDPDIDAVTASMIDLYHLSIVLQARIAEDAVPSAAVVKGGHLKDSIFGLLKLTSHEQDAFLLDSEYAPLWEKLILSKDAALFDVYADDYIMTLCKKAKLQAFGIFPLYAFLFAKLRDIKNVRLILSGKSQLLPEKEIEKRVCIAYEL